MSLGSSSTLCCAVSLESIISGDHSSSLTEYPSAGPVNEKPKQILLEEMERGWWGGEEERGEREEEKTGEERVWREGRERRENGVRAARKRRIESLSLCSSVRTFKKYL